MQGTDSKQAEWLFRGIVNYYSDISGSEITAAQVATRDKIIANNGIVCDNSLDAQVLALQDAYVAADDATTPADTKAAQKQAIESAIALLG